VAKDHEEDRKGSRAMIIERWWASVITFTVAVLVGTLLLGS
jgi:hypothetical protein